MGYRVVTTSENMTGYNGVKGQDYGDLRGKYV